MLWLLPLLALGLLWISPRLVRGRAQVSSQNLRLFPLRTGRGRLEAQAFAPLPVLLRLERGGEGVLSLLPGGQRALVWGNWQWSETFSFSPRRRGQHTLPGVRVFARDVLGLFEHEVQVELSSQSILAYPEAFALASPDLRMTLLADGPETTGGLEDPSRFAGVREYAPGDTLARFHWKATAQHAKPMVREYAKVKSSGVWLHLDLEGQGKPGEVYLEHATALAASLLLAASQSGLSVGVSFGQQQVGLGKGHEHLSRCLEGLASARLQNGSPVPIPPPGVNLLLITQEASLGVIEGALQARARASRVHLIALPEGFYLRPGEKGRPVFGKTDGILRLLKKRSLLESEGVRVHLLRGNDLVLRIAQ